MVEAISNSSVWTVTRGLAAAQVISGGGKNGGSRSLGFVLIIGRKGNPKAA
ncbi:hypothetical protein L195_g051370, partial [Trifolium pratense]